MLLYHKHHRLVDLINVYFYISEAGNQNQSLADPVSSKHYTSWLVDSCLLGVSSDGRRRKGREEEEEGGGRGRGRREKEGEGRREGREEGGRSGEEEEGTGGEEGGRGRRG